MYFVLRALLLFIFPACATLSQSSPEARPQLRVSVVSFPIQYSRSLSEYKAKLEGYVEAAAQENSELIVFPELAIFDLILIGGDPTPRQLERIADNDTPRVLEFARRLSRQYNIAILSGTYPRREASNNKIYNTAFLHLPDGREFSEDKRFLTPDEVSYGWSAGEKIPQSFDAPWGPTILLTCYDVEFPLITQAIVPEKPEIILVPSMTGPQGYSRVKHTSIARAIEHHAYVIVSGTVDHPQSPRDHFTGNAAIYEPFEKEYVGIRESSTMDEAGIVHDTIDLAKIRRTRQTASIYPARDQLR